MRDGVWLIAGLLLCGALAISTAGCGPSQAETDAELEQARNAQAKAAAAQQAAREAQEAADRATAAADHTRKVVDDATAEINRVGRHLEQMERDEDDDAP